MVEEARLESVYTSKGYHEFESRSLRNNGEIPAVLKYIAGIFIFQLVHLMKEKNNEMNNLTGSEKKGVRKSLFCYHRLIFPTPFYFRF